MTIRNFPQLDYPKTYGRPKGWWMYRMHFRIMKRHPAVVGVSEAVADNLRNNFGIHARVIHNGVDTKKFYLATTEMKMKARRSLNLPENAKIFVSIGHLTKLKQ